MDEAGLDDLRKELAELEAEERLVSAERRRLHDKIDHGYGTDETRAREREVSDHRRELHSRIDSLREQLGEPPVAPSRGAGLLQALGQVADGERVPVLDPHVGRVKELEEDVHDPELLEHAPEGFGSEI